MVQVDCSSAKASILQQAVAMRQALQGQIAAAWTDSNRAVSERYAAVVTALIAWAVFALSYSRI